MPNYNEFANPSPRDQDMTKPADDLDKISPYIQDVINKVKGIRRDRGPLSD